MVTDRFNEKEAMKWFSCIRVFVQMCNYSIKESQNYFFNDVLLVVAYFSLLHFFLSFFLFKSCQNLSSKLHSAKFHSKPPCFWILILRRNDSTCVGQETILVLRQNTFMGSCYFFLYLVHNQCWVLHFTRGTYIQVFITLLKAFG